MSPLHFELLPGTFAICRLDADAAIPKWAKGEFTWLARTPDELSVVCLQENVPRAVECERGWRCLRVAGKLDFSMVGVIASLACTLAAASVSVFVISTFDTDYFLVKDAKLKAALKSMSTAGHTCKNLDQARKR